MTNTHFVKGIARFQIAERSQTRAIVKMLEVQKEGTQENFGYGKITKATIDWGSSYATAEAGGIFIVVCHLLLLVEFPIDMQAIEEWVERNGASHFKFNGGDDHHIKNITLSDFHVV